MGYRSDVRIKLLKKDFEKLCKDWENERKKLTEPYYDYNLLEDFDIIKDIKGNIFNPETREWEVEQQNIVYFGWNWIKWYNFSEDYKDVCFIDNFVRQCDHSAYLRIGEETGDIEIFATNMDDINYEIVIKDDE